MTPSPSPIYSQPNQVCTERGREQATLVFARIRAVGLQEARTRQPIYFRACEFYRLLPEAFLHFRSGENTKQKSDSPLRNSFLTFHQTFVSVLPSSAFVVGFFRRVCALWNKVHAAQYFLVVFLHTVACGSHVEIILPPPGNLLPFSS